MADSPFETIETQFRQALADCQQLYLSAARECIEQHPSLIRRPPQDFLQLMADLHKGLLIKIYGSVVEADLRWTAGEARLAAVLLEHVWNEKLTGDRLRTRPSTWSRKAAASLGTASFGPSTRSPPSASASARSRRSSSASPTSSPNATAS